MRPPRPLTAEEQANVRRALHYLHARIGTWIGTARAAHMKRRTVRRVRDGGRVRPYVAQKIAAVAGVSIEDLRAGKFPPSEVCRYCGRSDNGC